MESKTESIIAELREWCRSGSVDPGRLIAGLAAEVIRLANANERLVQHNAHLREEVRRVLVRN
jgi:hypothetical protein